ncbi:hypothetical protein LGN19_08075 [Burkholderia sp. AU30198]|nr:hypothetical protein [Burkholderia sp. AU30198]
MGRFINQDPIWLMDKTSLYQYTLNPISWIDPFGLSPCSSNSTFGSFEDCMARSRGKADVYLRCARRQVPNYLQITKDKSVRQAQNPGCNLGSFTDEVGLPINPASTVGQAITDAKYGKFSRIGDGIDSRRSLCSVCCSVELTVVTG